MMMVSALVLVLVEVDGVSTRVGVLLKFKIFGRESERSKYFVSEVFQCAKHLFFQFFVSLIYSVRERLKMRMC